MRRCASSPAVKEALYGSADEALDIALADALIVISRKGPLRMGEVAELMHITPASATRAVGCLVNRGFVTRGRAEGDQRSIVVSATKEGRAHYRVIRDLHVAAMDQMLANFSEDEEDLLADFLERFTAGVRALTLEAAEAHGSSSSTQSE
jgi:DNA-binding MarR family transcriptional regulator